MLNQGLLATSDAVSRIDNQIRSVQLSDGRTVSGKVRYSPEGRKNSNQHTTYIRSLLKLPTKAIFLQLQESARHMEENQVRLMEKAWPVCATIPSIHN